MQYKKLGKTGLKVSRLGLGTAEIGFAYGIGQRPVPSDRQAEQLLKTALDFGINYFDTASMYCLAEERLGRFGVSGQPGVVVGTKCGSFLDKDTRLTTTEMERQIREEIDLSRRNLHLDVLPLAQLHGGSKEQILNGEIAEIMQGLKTEGKIQHIGISTRGEEAACAAIESGYFDVIQVALSILDQRMVKQVLPLALENNVGVINRSALLKGALTDLVSSLPDQLGPLRVNSSKARKIAKELICTLPALALRFTLAEPAISTTLIGTNKIHHLKAAWRAVDSGCLPEDFITQLRDLAIEDPSQVDPARWPSLT